ncbi:ATP-binding protein [Gandjariella thermophila]|uniref:Histidine kinase/HSP90-like ATPase domain-containing protein n=1 Tax=Gandjariella thermophila TaxID=1931992 RepID=A0A4D4J3F7_9PSEU|nr:ATP-binding protein [Gandjariella thermophila]GDY29026.1 hypothetical protein GTS_06590 [Gandjariella thermophila]
MNTHTTQVDDLQLIAQPSAVKCADMFVRFTLSEWSLRPLADEAAEVACRLVQATVDGTGSGTPGFVTVRLRLRGDSLVVEVEDDQPASAAGQPPALNGRRVDIVHKDHRGKVMWCELPLPGGVNASSVPLPHREPRRSPAAERLADEPPGVDPHVMERILAGLSRSGESPVD